MTYPEIEDHDLVVDNEALDALEVENEALGRDERRETCERWVVASGCISSSQRNIRVEDPRRGANTCGDGAPTSGLAVRSLNQTSKCALENHSMAAASERQPCEAQPRELDPNRAELSTSDPQLRTLSTHRQVRNTSSTTLRRAEQISVHRDTDDANDDGLRHRGRKWGARTRRASTMGRLH